jgi:hypothetical protein
VRSGGVHPQHVKTTTREWLDGLRAFAVEHRIAKPLAAPSPDTAAAWAAERSILGAALATRLADLEPLRAARASSPGADPDPAVVLTTSAPGIVAAEAIIDGSPDLAALVGDRLVAVVELEYRRYCMRNPDDAHRHHVTLWNWVKTRVPEQRQAEFARHRLAPGEAWWLHREGVAGAGALDRRASHLWKWNGRHAALLEPFVVEFSVPRVGR